MEFTFLPKELGVEFTLHKIKHVIKVGMKVPEVEAILGQPEDYHIKKYDPEEEDLYKTKEEWHKIFGRSKKAIYIYKGLLLAYYADVLEVINVQKPAKAFLDGKNLLGLRPNPLYQFMKEKGYVRVSTFSSGDSFRTANISVSYDWYQSGPSWVAISDLSKEKSDFPEDEKLGLTLMNCPTRVKE